VADKPIALKRWGKACSIGAIAALFSSDQPSPATQQGPEEAGGELDRADGTSEDLVSSGRAMSQAEVDDLLPAPMLFFVHCVP